MTSGYDPDFASVAEYYSGRIPYLPGFFAKAVEYFDISKNSTVLELGCGTAELSLGFSPYCKSVLAIDKSPEMVSHRRETPDNVRFLLADLNAEIGALPVQADLVAIGRAIYFFDKEKVVPLLNAVTAASAAIFICGAVISRRTPWLAQYETLRKRYRTRNVALDIYGEAFFAATRWSRGQTLAVTAAKQFSARDLLNHALSHPCTSKDILETKDDFERSLEKVLIPYYGTSNCAEAEIVSWGVEYRRT